MAPAGRDSEELPRSVDLRDFFPAAYDQRELGASTAHACVGLVEYFDRRSFGRCEPLSRLFLHKVTHRLLGTRVDQGTNLRAALKAMVSFGIPPERYCGYRLSHLDEELDAFLYGFNAEFRSVHYVRLEGRNTNGGETLRLVKEFLAAGFPSAFGIAVPGSILDDGSIPYRPMFDHVVGGQSLVAVGYDDDHPISARGALLVRNSWGPGWGEEGYGWLPYAFVEEQLAVDFWTLLKPEWFESKEFARPSVAPLVPEDAV